MKEKHESFIRKSVPRVLPVLLAFSIFFVVSKIYTILLISPDDISMRDMISGAMTGLPDGHCVFIRYPLAAALAGLFKISPALDWYKLFLLSCHLLCLYLVFSRCWEHPPKRAVLYCIACCFFVLIVWLKNIVNLEWTTTAGTLGMTAIYRYCTMPQSAKKQKLLLEYSICLVLLAVGFCLRHTVILMFIPLAGICWLKKMVDVPAQNQNERIRYYLHQMVFLICAGILLLAIMVSHSMAYRSDEWKAYTSYTQDRSSLVDYYGYPDYDTYQETYEEAGISYEMYRLMKYDYNYLFAFSNSEEINLHSIAELAENIAGQRTIFERLDAFYDDLMSIIVDKDIIWTLFLIVILLINILSAQKADVKNSVYIAAVLLWFTLVAFYLLCKGRFPVRVAHCMLLGLLAVLGGCYFGSPTSGSATDKKTRKRTNLVTFMIAVILLGSMSLLNMFEIYRDNSTQKRQANITMELTKYCNARTENIYFYDFWSYSQFGEPLNETLFTQNYIRAGGWPYNTPAYNSLLERNNCSSLTEAIKYHQNIFYLVNKSRSVEVRARLDAYFASADLPVRTVLLKNISTVPNHVNALWLYWYKD